MRIMRRQSLPMIEADQILVWLTKEGLVEDTVVLIGLECF
jgi:hypothetical protein